MKNLILGFALAILLLNGNAFAQTQSDDKQTIISLLSHVTNAWNSGDVNIMAGFLTEDCVHIDPFGDQLTGRETIKNRLQWVMETYYKTSKPTLENSGYSIQFVRPDVAIATFLMKDSHGASRETVVVTRTESGWKVASFQNIPVADLPKVDGK